MQARTVIGLLIVIATATASGDAQAYCRISADGGSICLDAVESPAANSGLRKNRARLAINAKSKNLLFKDSLYVVDLQCNGVRYQSKNDPWAIFVEKTRATSHIIAITDRQIGDKELPKDGRAYITVYSITDGARNKSTFINQSCSQPFVLSGRQNVWLSATALQGDTNKPSVLTSFLYSVVHIALSVGPAIKDWTRFNNDWKDPLKGVNDTDDDIKSIIALLDKVEVSTKSDPLRQEKTEITTPYSSVTANVYRIESIVRHGIKRFRKNHADPLLDDFKKAVEAMHGQVKLGDVALANLPTKCAAYAESLKALNFSTDDIAFALSYILVQSGVSIDRDKTIACLGRKYALLALRPDIVEFAWDKDDGPPYREQDVKAALLTGPVLPPQPDYKIIKTAIQNAVNAVGGYLKSTPGERTKLTSSLATFFTPSIEIENISTALQLENSVNAIALADRFAEKAGRIGCTTSDAVEGAAVTFLFLRKGNSAADQTKFKDNDALALHLWVDGDRKITHIRIDQDDAASVLERALDARKSRICGEIEVEKPSGGDKP